MTTRQSVEVRCLSHVGMTVSDLDRSVGFYRDLFGFRVCYEARDDRWGRVGLGLGDMVLELFSDHPDADRVLPLDMLYPAPYGRPKLALTVEDVNTAYETLISQGVEVLGPVTETGVSQFFFALDPDGTMIQLHQFAGGYERLIEMFPLDTAR
jgi:glyoxylase I family protein